MKKRRFIVIGLLLVAFIGGIVWIIAGPREPAYKGKKLSVWLDELCVFDSLHQRAQGAVQIQAIRAIGTNAIPWLLHEYRHNGSCWKWRLKNLLNKQHLIKFRFRDPNFLLWRATVGILTLREMAEPAIPDLLALVEIHPGYIPGALAGIGPPAVPALQQCLTNMTIYPTIGSDAIIPGNTIGDIINATTFGSFSFADIGIFLPAVKAWAGQTTNQHAQTRAQIFLSRYDLRQ